MARSGRSWFAAGLVVPLLALGGWSAQPHAAPSGGWSKALVVRGAPRADGGEAEVVSCASAGNCVAAGDYGLSGSEYVFAISEVRGTWGKAVTIPGTARTSKAGGAPGGLACPSAGGCVLVGSYVDAAGHNQAFISSQVRGTWHKIIWVPGLTKLDRGQLRARLRLVRLARQLRGRGNVYRRRRGQRSFHRHRDRRNLGHRRCRTRSDWASRSDSRLRDRFRAALVRLARQLHRRRHLRGQRRRRGIRHHRDRRHLGNTEGRARPERTQRKHRRRGQRHLLSLTGQLRRRRQLRRSERSLGLVRG